MKTCLYLLFSSLIAVGDFNESRFFVIYHENRGVDANGNVIFEEKNISKGKKTAAPSNKIMVLELQKNFGASHQKKRGHGTFQRENFKDPIPPVF